MGNHFSQILEVKVLTKLLRLHSDHVYMIGAVGDDDNGQQILSNLKKQCKYKVYGYY